MHPRARTEVSIGGGGGGQNAEWLMNTFILHKTQTQNNNRNKNIKKERKEIIQ